MTEDSFFKKWERVIKGIDLKTSRETPTIAAHDCDPKEVAGSQPRVSDGIAKSEDGK